MIFETLMQTPTADNYDKHQHLERQFKPGGIDVARDYLWAYLPGGREAVVRRHAPVGDNLAWDALEPPSQDAKVRFSLLTHVREKNRDATVINGLRRRRTELDYDKNIDWLISQAHYNGLVLMDGSVDMQPILIPIRNPANSFTLRAAQFHGIGFVRRPERFAGALLTGLGNGKGFGLGFIFFSTFGSHK